MQLFTWPSERAAVERFFEHSDENLARVESAVEVIIDEVRRRGDRANADYTQKFDKVTIKRGEFTVDAERLTEAWRTLPAPLKRALRKAKRRIETFHKTQRLKGWTIREKGFGRIDQRILPLDRVAVYVPAGEAPLVSTVLMSVIPAKVAGVGEIVMLTPPQAHGWPDPGILAAAHLAGVDRVCRLGSAWAVASAAFGTESVPRVDKVVGPGNPYVTVAKQRLFGRIGIDSPAGPSEVLILADTSAPLEYVAADLLAQAEHTGDNPVGVVLIGGGKTRARKLQTILESQLLDLSRAELARRSLENHGYIILARTEDQAVEIANMKAPEHLQIIAKGQRAMAERIRHAAATFLGPWSPVPLGDYMAGPNHTLPTSATARFFSPLGVWDFYKENHIIEATQAGLAALADDVATLAEAEQLTAHAQAVRVRQQR